MARRVLVIGGTGNFGRRLCRNLARVPGLEILLASRRLERAADVVARISAGAVSMLTPVAFDRDAIGQVAALGPWAVIDASGPFQGANYDLPRGALEQGAHFIDLADARDYLMGFSALDDLARAKGLVALTGASSTPALSSAVVAALCKGWQRVDAVDIAITPDGSGDVGEAVVAAILSYAGRPVTQFRFGRLNTVLGGRDRRSFDIPGLGRRRVAAVETIDAELLQRKFNVRSRVAFYAGLESPIERGGLAALAQLRAWNVLRSLEPFGPLLASVLNITRLTCGDKGGMSVEVTGLDEQGGWCRARWSMLAQGGQGLNAPGLPAVAAVRLLLAGELKPGARIADEIPLAAIEREFAGLPITRQRERVAGRSAFAGALGGSLDALAKPIADLHSLNAAPIWKGEASVERGKGFVSRVIGSLIGLPDATERILVRFALELEPDGRQRWTRVFGDRSFYSVMTPAADGKVWERFGLMSFRLGLAANDKGELLYPVTAGRFLGIPMPRFLLPGSDTLEFVDALGRFNFSVRISLPFFGLLAHYRGWLLPEEIKDES